MIENYDDFIGVYKNAVPEGYCSHMIDEFERLRSEGMGRNRMQEANVLPHAKDDVFMFLENGTGALFKPFQEAPVLRHFYNATQAAFEAYTSRFSILKEDPIIGTSAKMQKTHPGGGYHIWHGEQGPGTSAARVLTYMLYLNTLEPEDGGETEFLYQRLRLRPEEGTLVVWPASFTHAHRGNMVLGNKDKYVITGWFYYN